MLRCCHRHVQVLTCSQVMKTGEKCLKNMSYHEYKSNRRIERERRRGHHEEKSIILSAPDKTLLLVVTFLVIIGFLAIFSATAPKCMREGANLASFLIKQMIYAGFGFLAMGWFAKFDYKKLERYNTKFLWIVAILLLVLQFTPLGVTINGAKRWINLGFMQLQPSELAKPLFCMLLASNFKEKVDLLNFNNWTSTFIPILILLGIIYKQPNLSMVIILLTTSFMLYIAARGSLKLVAILGGLGFAGALFYLPKLLQGYQMDRINVWLNPGSDALGKGYNIIQSLIAFASGGFIGTGYGGSIQKLAYLPECHTDFIFAIIGEEFGYLGCLFIIGLFTVLVYRGLRIAKRCPDMYGKLLAIGITVIFGFQAFLNMSVASSFFPVTGVTLPFISYGGTSIIVSLAMVGILLNISKQRIKRIRTENEQ
ncbi:TPA: putative lipid II flippase FtsW [Candidatus Gastranaerophilales bacterium HUM_6]|nr:MAG TPA: putative lipid II flippase FtsW [Candidatus Gastranaerophilales bacterium HUM_7]DAA93010.1 MAG TPA: putative lipid II flippase FtsW [Candidatus Gastranaerophilales bacterium HUM_6]DAB02921.1 MAG TPA: putative lipid II flippase FtsW [Candidatus Gastranaerophilales bacterium HUM_12]DAB04962.1 MAG TPA: putative lipid II flippase FtsW [Candidatus Gastranaerophilales bacterium HUM_14]